MKLKDEKKERMARLRLHQSQVGRLVMDKSQKELHAELQAKRFR